MSAPQQQLNRLATEKDKLTKELERTRGIIKVSDACEVCFILFPLSLSLSLFLTILFSVREFRCLTCIPLSMHNKQTLIAFIRQTQDPFSPDWKGANPWLSSPENAACKCQIA